MEFHFLLIPFLNKAINTQVTYNIRIVTNLKGQMSLIKVGSVIRIN
jgi:hypothetical protein